MTLFFWFIIVFVVTLAVRATIEHRRHRKVMRLLQEGTDLAKQSSECSARGETAVALLLLEESVDKAKEARRLMR